MSGSRKTNTMRMRWAGKCPAGHTIATEAALEHSGRSVDKRLKQLVLAFASGSRRSSVTVSMPGPDFREEPRREPRGYALRMKTAAPGQASSSPSHQHLSRTLPGNTTADGVHLTRANTRCTQSRMKGVRLQVMLLRHIRRGEQNAEPFLSVSRASLHIIDGGLQALLDDEMIIVADASGRRPVVLGLRFESPATKTEVQVLPA